jgi:hypothetical protein
MIGKSCLIAQLSGIDWKVEKLQKYVSDSVHQGLQIFGHFLHRLQFLQSRDAHRFCKPTLLGGR